MTINDTASIARRAFVKSFGWLRLHSGQTQSAHGFGINVLDHGATPSEPGDDTSAIQDAIDKAAARGGGIVLFPVGIYNVSQLRLGKRVVLQGEGWGSRIVQHGGTDGSLIVLANPNVDQTIVRDLSLHGNAPRQSTINHGIYYLNEGGRFSTGNARHLVQNVLVDQCSGSGVVLHTAAGETRIENVTARRCGLYGFDFLTRGATDCWLVNCTAQTSGRSGFRCASWTTRYIGCKAFGNGQSAVRGDASGFLINHPYQYLSACDAQENHEHGFHLSRTANCILCGCAAVSNRDTGFLLSRSSDVVLEACNVAHIRLPSGLQHAYGVDLRDGCSNNVIHVIVTGVTASPMAPAAELTGNRIVIGPGSGLETWGGAGARPAVVTSEPASRLDDVVRRLPVYDGTGTLLGYIPIYGSIR